MTQVNGHESQEAFFSIERWLEVNLALWSNDEVVMFGSVNSTGWELGDNVQKLEV